MFFIKAAKAILLVLGEILQNKNTHPFMTHFERL
jgi:hypothetical protein